MQIWINIKIVKQIHTYIYYFHFLNSSMIKSIQIAKLLRKIKFTVFKIFYILYGFAFLYSTRRKKQRQIFFNRIYSFRKLALKKLHMNKIYSIPVHTHDPARCTIPTLGAIVGSQLCLHFIIALFFIPQSLYCCNVPFVTREDVH